MIYFGPAGNSDSFYAQGHASTVEMPKWLRERGLNTFEYSFGRGVRLSEAKGAEIGREAQACGIRLSIHMPYFVNLAVTEKEKRQKNISYFLESLCVAQAMGASRAVFHPGSASGGDRAEILQGATAFFKEILAVLDEHGLGGVTLCPETMGKINQLGSLQEVIALCRVDERVWPAVDFGHLHCRGMGCIQGKADYAAILDELENGVGKARARTMHVHFSRIEFTRGGEKMHHTFADTQYGPEFAPLAELTAQRGYEPVFICESRGTQAEDAACMRKLYETARNSLLNGQGV